MQSRIPVISIFSRYFFQLSLKLADNISAVLASSKYDKKCRLREVGAGNAYGQISYGVIDSGLLTAYCINATSHNISETKKLSLYVIAHKHCFRRAAACIMVWTLNDMQIVHDSA